MCKSCRSRRELSNEYLVAKSGFDTAENEPLEVCQKVGKVRMKVRKKGKGCLFTRTHGSRTKPTFFMFLISLDKRIIDVLE